MYLDFIELLRSVDLHFSSNMEVIQPLFLLIVFSPLLVFRDSNYMSIKPYPKIVPHLFDDLFVFLF